MRGSKHAAPNFGQKLTKNIIFRPQTHQQKAWHLLIVDIHNQNWVPRSLEFQAYLLISFLCIFFIKFPPIIGGERNMKQRIPINSINSKLVLKSMYASCSTGPFFADHYSHRFEKTQLKFRQEKWLPVKISCIIWNEICKKNKLIKNRNGIFCQKFLIFLKSLKSLNKNFY